jgi:nucleotide-binding universal stress UspA family protein
MSAHVTAGLDGSPAAQVAVDWAIEEARARRLPLRLVHVVQWPVGSGSFAAAATGDDFYGMRAAAENLLRDRRDHARALVPDLTVTTHLLDGYVAAEMIAESRTAALLVVGQRGLGGFAGLVRGSVSTHLTAHAHCPVLVVPPDTPARAAVTGRVVAGLDDSPQAQPVLDYAAAEAAWRSVPLIVVHACPPADPRLPPATRAAATGAAGQWLAGAVTGWREKLPGLRIRERIAHGAPAGALLAEVCPATCWSSVRTAAAASAACCSAPPARPSCTTRPARSR